MTFVLSMKFDNAMVICADSLEADGVTKRTRNKIDCFHARDWAVAWGGSGAANVVDKFSGKLKQVLRTVKSYNHDVIEDHFDTTLTYIQQQCQVGERLEIVAGLCTIGVGEQEMFIYRGDLNSAVISPESEYCAAGMDTTLAKFLMASLYHPQMGIEEAQELGVFVTGLMCKYADGVERPIQVVFHIPTIGWTRVESKRLAVLDKAFSSEDAAVNLADYWGRCHPNSWIRIRKAAELLRLNAKIKRLASQRLKQEQ